MQPLLRKDAKGDTEFSSTRKFFSGFSVTGHQNIETTTMESDAALLDRYVTHRDETAFRQIVERHAGMVLGVARRRTGDAALGEEAGQIVFTLLARKAPALRHLPPERLGGWLHRTALLTAGNLLRSEMRRRLHHERFASEAAGSPSLPDESAWTAALPLVDEAIDSLSEADRQLVVQHFFQRRTFRELGTGTGRTEDAMRKRAGRALEHLSAFFRRRGIVLSAGALMTGLSQHVAEAAPSGYAATTAAAAVNKASSVSTFAVISNTLATMTLSKITVTAAALAFVAPIGLHWSSDGSTQAAQATSASALIVKETPGSASRLTKRTAAAPGSAPATARSNTLALFAQELAKIPPPPEPVEEDSITELQRLVFALPEPELEQAFQLLRSTPENGAVGPAVSALAARWAETSPSEALRLAAGLPKTLQASAWSGALQVWARRDFDAAFAWACAQPEGDDRNIQLDTVYHDLMKRDPETALARLKEVPSGEKQRHYRQWTLDVWRNSDPEAAIAWITNNGSVQSGRELNEFIRGWAGNRPELAVEYALKLVTNPKEREETIGISMMQWGMHDPAAAIDKLLSLPPELQTANVARHASPFIANGDVNGLVEATRKMPAGEFRDSLRATAVERLASTDIEQAKAMIKDISATESRQQAAIAIGSQWMRRDPAAARPWIEASADLPADLKKHLLRIEKK